MRSSPGLRARLALGFGGILLGLALGEGAVRALGGGRASMTRGMFFVFDAEAGKRCRPDADLRFVLPGSFDVHVRSNAEGLRDREHDLVKPAGTHRVLCLGDSFAWGYGVENQELFSTRLEAELPGNVEAINFGVAGYNSVQELARLETDGRAYSPDWTVVLFCDNDLDGNFVSKEAPRPIADLHSDTLRVLNRPVHESWTVPVTRWFHEHSRLVVEVYYCLDLLREQARERRTAERVRASSRPTAPSVPATPPREKSVASLEPGDMEFSLVDRFVEPDARMDRAWRTLEQVYAALRDEVARQGGRLLVVYVADPILTLPERRDAALAQCGVARTQVRWDRPGTRLEGMCDRLGVPCVNLVPAFRAAAQPEKLFLVGNDHWSAAGHALAAQRVAERLRELDTALR